MEIKYVRNINGSHMVLKQADREAAWERKMLQQNPLEGLMVPDFVNENGEELLWYDITGRQALDVVSETKEIDYETLCRLCDAVERVAEKLEKLLLSPDSILLKPECIFIRNHSNEICLCYYPQNPDRIDEGFHELMHYVLRKLNHKDPHLVELGYRLFEETAREGYSLKELLQISAAANCREEEIMGVPEMMTEELPVQDRESDKEETERRRIYRIKRKESRNDRKKGNEKERRTADVFTKKWKDWILGQTKKITGCLPGKMEKEPPAAA